MLFFNVLGSVFIVIPARLESSRLKRKLLLPLEGRPLILHTLEKARQVKSAEVIVASDSEQIIEVVRGHCEKAVLTSRIHESGSDRVAEVAEKLPENSVVVNLQADEPLISPSVIEKAIKAMVKNGEADIVTICERISEIQDVLNPNVVKVVLDSFGFALYFSRSAIPFPREAMRQHGSLELALRNDTGLLSLFRKHMGLYVYRRETLLKFSQMARTNLETAENLEQLRALENGFRIRVLEVEEGSIGVDTEEDFEKVQQILKRKRVF